MSVVQQIGFDGQLTSAPAVTITASTAGNTIIVAVAGNAPSGVPTDNLSTVWPAATIGPMTNSGLLVYLLQNCPGGITTITVHVGDGQGWIVEESGLLTASLDKFTSQSSSGASVTSGNTATLSQANEVCYGIFGHDSTAAFSASGSWSAAAFTNYGGPGAPYTPGNQGNTLAGDVTFIERQVVIATTALAATATITSSTVDAAIITLMQHTSILNTASIAWVT